MNTETRVDLASGRKMPVIGLGTWKLTRDTAASVEAALRAGYRMIDTACDYGSQAGIGEALKTCGLARNEVFVVTKIEEDDDPRGGMERDLGELQLDHADLTLIHRPPPDGLGEALWRGLAKAQEDGLVRDIGVSNYSAAAVDALMERTGIRPSVNQVEWTPFGHDLRFLDHHRRHGIVVQAYSPLTRAERLDNESLARIAEANGKTAAQVLVRWNLQHGTVPLPKANQPDHFRENIDVFDFELSQEDMDRLDALDEKFSALGGLPYG